MTVRLDDAHAMNRQNRSYFRFVEVEDAEFTLSLRSDSELSKHLNKTSFELDAQRRWIDAYKTREAQGDEYYFVIVCEGRNQGVVRLYDFRDVDGKRSFCWGSWIIAPPRPKGLVTYSALCVYEIGFDILQFEMSHFDVRRSNDKVNEFHLRAGAAKVAENDLDIFYTYTKDAYIGFLASSTEQVSQHRNTFNV
jgi:RimJ/RimL family protein N-acetyltransferase